MAKPRSFISNISIDVVQRAHNCQHNSAHRLVKGDIRLKLKDGRAVEYFCGKCALESISKDIQRLESIRRQLEAGRTGE